MRKLLPLLFLLCGAMFAQTIQNDNPPPFDSQSTVTFDVQGVAWADQVTICESGFGNCPNHSKGSISFLFQGQAVMTWTDVVWTHTPIPARPGHPAQPWFDGCFNSCTDTTHQNVQYAPHSGSTWYWFDGETVLR